MSTFLQSLEWEEIQKRAGKKTWRVGGRLVVRHALPAGFNYLYSPRPMMVTSNWLSNIAAIADRERSLFFKIDPSESLPPEILKLKNTKSASSIQPRQTIILDVQEPDDVLLARMHEKTRYNIRLAARSGVAVTQTLRQQRGEDEAVFERLLQETATRNEFYTHEPSYYKNLLSIKTAEFSNELFFAVYEKIVCAAALVNFYRPSGTATYLHGASTRREKAVMAPHLLHWQIIQEARRRGFTQYDFWGIDETRWPGVTRFKRGFGGAELQYPSSVDCIYRPFVYQLYNGTHIVRNFFSR